MTNQEFIETIAPIMIKYAKQYGHKIVSAAIAQACLESGYGTSPKAKHHNYFGLKYRKNRVTCNQGYFEDGGSEQNSDGTYTLLPSDTAWYNFPTMEAGCEGYYQFINISTYSKAKLASTPMQYLQALKEVTYATDINYVSKVNAIVIKQNLEKYDKMLNVKEVKNKMAKNSSLVNYTKLSPNNSGTRTHSIDRITPHCIVGQWDVTTIGNHFANPATKASCNYGIAKDGKVALIVDEDKRSWCSSSNENDQRAVTIECASDTKTPYAFNEAVYNKLIELCVDICKRNHKNKLIWIADKNIALNYKQKENEMLLTVHRWFKQKACIPADSEVLTKNGWKSLKEIKIGEEIVTTKDPASKELIFSPVKDIIEPYLAKTITCQNFVATPNHRLLYWHKTSKDIIKFATYEELLKRKTHIIRLPLASQINKTEGINLSDSLLKFLIAVQADGHYMKEETDQYYGVEFHFKKERKIERMKDILKDLQLDYTICNKSDNSVSIKIWNQNNINIVEDICEKYLFKKCFTWRWINLSKEQARIFLDEILLWDGCKTANLYSSNNKINLDIVSAIASINERACHIKNNNVDFRKNNEYSIDGYKNYSINKEELVSCVTVESGAFLCRQPNGYIFITGNCPGDWLMARMSNLANEVTKRLGGDSFTPIQTESPKPVPAPYIIQVTASNLNIRSGAGTNFPIVGMIKDRGKYTIVEEKDGWGLLKSYSKNRNGWINLKYTRKI